MDHDNSDGKKPFDIESYWAIIQGKFVKQEVATKLTIAPVTPEANFKKDLMKGQQYEHEFYLKFSKYLTRTDGRKGDFEVTKTSELIELKSDSYNHNHTNNFFIERYSSGTKNGGPFQADEHGVDYFVYWFPLSGHIYVFNLKQLLRKLNKITKNLDLISVRNQGYVTRGYKIPRDLLKSIALTPEDIGLYGE